MARKRTRPETKAEDTPAKDAPTPKSLAARAAELRRLVRERVKRDEQAVMAQGLETRREEIRETVQVATHLAGVREIFSSAEISVSLGKSALAQLATSAAAVRRAFLDDPGSLAKPRAFDRAEYQRILSGARDALVSAWRTHVAPPDGEGLAGVLERYEPFRKAALRLKDVQQALSTQARSLPKKEDLKKVRSLKERGAALLRDLALDAVLIDFLTRAQTSGYGLEELLENETLVEQLRTTGLLSCLRIVTA
jgi:hypothetical protein